MSQMLSKAKLDSSQTRYKRTLSEAEKEAHTLYIHNSQQEASPDIQNKSPNMDVSLFINSISFSSL